MYEEMILSCMLRGRVGVDGLTNDIAEVVHELAAQKQPFDEASFDAAARTLFEAWITAASPLTAELHVLADMNGQKT
jgi:hypothetical protein